VRAIPISGQKMLMNIKRMRPGRHFDLGINDLIFLDEPETRLKTSKRLLETLVDLFDKSRPDLVYIPSFIENHIDHFELNRIFFRLVKRLDGIFNVCAYEVWSPIFPNIIIDIGKVIEKKELAIREYKSQIRQVDYLNTTLALNKYRSAMNLHGRSYAEAFFFSTSKEYIALIKKLGLDRRIFSDIAVRPS
jgi:LmbE family N-acetylglucosaminyl deacetylase